MTFNESNTIEAYLCDLVSRPVARNAVRDAAGGYGVGLGALCPPGRDAPAPLGWQPVAAADLQRQPQEVFVESQVRAALIRLNPEIAARPERADEVLYKLRAIVLCARSDGLVKCNEEFTAWLRGERSMPFGPNHEHVTVRLIDFKDLENNQYVVTTQYGFRAGPAERRADAMLLVNGFPLVLIETKTPPASSRRPRRSWSRSPRDCAAILATRVSSGCPSGWNSLRRATRPASCTASVPQGVAGSGPRPGCRGAGDPARRG